MCQGQQRFQCVKYQEMRTAANPVRPVAVLNYLRECRPEKFQTNREHDAVETLELVLSCMHGSLQQMWQARVCWESQTVVVELDTFRIFVALLSYRSRTFLQATFNDLRIVLIRVYH